MFANIDNNHEVISQLLAGLSIYMMTFTAKKLFDRKENDGEKKILFVLCVCLV